MGRSFVFEQADLVVSTLTVQCKVRAPAWAWLDQAAREVNQVWNFCNATSFKAAHGRYGGRKRWLSGFDMSKLLAGVGDCFEKSASMWPKPWLQNTLPPSRRHPTRWSREEEAPFTDAQPRLYTFVSP